MSDERVTVVGSLDRRRVLVDGEQVYDANLADSIAEVKALRDSAQKLLDRYVERARKA